MALSQRLLTAVLAAALVVPVSFAPASADVRNRPDLTVTKGSVGISGQHAERLKGRFTVRNAGSLPASDSTAHVQAKVGTRWRKVTELRILPLAPKKNAAYAFNTKRPDFVGLGSKYPARVCLDVKGKIKEAREGNNCRSLGSWNFELVEPPNDVIDYELDTKFFHSFEGVGYYGWVPSGYDPNTATKLFVWLHGCGGKSEFDIDSFHAAPNESYITIAPIGAEGGCWDTSGEVGDEETVAAAVRDAAKHFTIDQPNIVLGGYSSGGDLAYRTAYTYSPSVAAVLAANTTPFRDTGLTPAVLPSVERKFRVVHLAHLGDTTYPIATVRSELATLQAGGFTVTSIEREGSHYDNPGAGGLPGTDADIRTYLLPQVDPLN